MNGGRKVTVLLMGLALIAGACGGADEVEVGDVWARTSAATQSAGVVYMTISGGDGADRLVSAAVSPSVAAMTELHETSMDESGAMSMHQIAGIDVPAGGEVRLEPGGLHLMLMGLTEPLQTGTEFDLTLTFEDAGEVRVTVPVREN